jgi:hypothetical protein
MSGQVWLNLQKCPALCSCFAWSSFILYGHKLIPWCVVASVLSMLVECQAAVCKKTLALATPKDKASCNLNLLNLLFFKWCRTIQGLICKLTYKGLWWLFKSRIAESISAYFKHRFPFGIWTSYPTIALNNTVSICTAYVSGYFPGVQKNRTFLQNTGWSRAVELKGRRKSCERNWLLMLMHASGFQCLLYLKSQPHIDNTAHSAVMESQIPVIFSFSLLFKVCNLPFKSILVITSWEHQRQYKLWRG